MEKSEVTESEWSEFLIRREHFVFNFAIVSGSFFRSVLYECLRARTRISIVFAHAQRQQQHFRSKEKQNPFCVWLPTAHRI